MTTAIPVNEIRIGSRFRKDAANHIDSLAQSIADIGLLHPIVVTPDGMLIAGARRVAAWQKAFPGKAIPCHVVDLDATVRGEAAENFERLPFKPSEAVAIAAALRPLEEKAAREREKVGGRGRRSGKLPDHLKGDVRDIVAKKVGLSGKTLEKAEAVVEAAKAEPEKFGKIRDAMDRTGRVHGPHKRLVVARKADIIRASPPPLPNGLYYAGSVDFPWPFDKDSDDPGDCGMHPYPTMSLAAIDAFMPKILAQLYENAWLWVWTTDYYLEEALRIVRASGLERKRLLTWDKQIIGRGEHLREQTEFCIMAARGQPVVTLTNQSTLLSAPRSKKHSEKPDAFYELVESLCPAPRYVEWFQCRERPNWDGYGDEATARAIAEACR